MTFAGCLLHNWSWQGVAGFVAEQSVLSEYVYENVNNGVYLAVFASKQESYERAVKRVFSALGELEEWLRDQSFLLGPSPVETDWRLFCMLIRFDAVYHGRFKCNIRRIVNYPRLREYLRVLYHWAGDCGNGEL